MAVFVWNESYRVNVKKCDEQHQKLFAIINELFEAMSAGKAREALDNVTAELAAYTQSHFRAEEELLRRAQYPKLAVHQGEHHKFEAEVAKLRSASGLGGSINAVNLLHFLKDWLANHIRQTDKQYSGYLNERGIS